MHRATLLAGFLGLLLPADCVVCGQPLESFNRSHVCRKCWDNITYIITDAGSVPPATTSTGEITKTKPGQPSVGVPGSYRDHTSVFCATEYTGSMPLAIKSYKYEGRRGVLRGFTQIIEHYLAYSSLTRHAFDQVIPVPLHVSRCRQRGFNQAEDLARILAARLHVPLNSKCLMRVIPTAPQTQLSGHERKSNVKKAFAMNHHQAHPQAGKTVLLVDDVYTTGSTLEAAARPLRNHGLFVQFFTLTRAVSASSDVIDI